MIVQELKNGKSKIRIETAVSPEDAKQNNFPEGEYVRYFIDDKRANGYNDVVMFMVKTISETGRNFLPNNIDLNKQKENIFKAQEEELRKGIEALNKTYKAQGIPEIKMDSIIEKNIEFKIDLFGMRE